MIKSYIDGPVSDTSRIGSGRINGTWLVTAEKRFILQKMNASLYGRQKAVLLHNYRQYRKAVDKSGEQDWLYPEWIPDREGHFFHADEAGDIWRMYEYIPMDEPSGSKSPDTDFYGIGKGLGTLHRILDKCEDIRTVDTTGHLHDLEYHYGLYRKVQASDVCRDKEIDELIEGCIKDLSDVPVKRDRIIHGDAKSANMIIAGGKVRGFIDLDTIMRGNVYDDLSDCIRSCCIDPDGHLNTDSVLKLQKGYEEGYEESLPDEAPDLLIKNVAKCRLLLGIRYYTDYLTNGHYFAEDHDGQNLEKARRLLKDCWG